MWNTLRRTILTLPPFLIFTAGTLSFFWRDVVLGRTSPCLFLADGLADSFGVGGDRLKVEPSGFVAVERANGVVAATRLIINLLLLLGLGLGVALVFVSSGVVGSSVIVPTEDSSLEVDAVEDVVPAALLAVVVTLAAMVAVLMLMALSLTAMMSVLMLLALYDVLLALAVMVPANMVDVLLAIAAAVVVGECVRELTLHRTCNGDCASSSSNAANTPSATSLSVADASTLATSASGFVSQAKHNLLPSSSSPRPHTGCTILKHPTQMLFESRIKLLATQRSP
jgi:hypothetical protein